MRHLCCTTSHQHWPAPSVAQGASRRAVVARFQGPPPGAGSSPARFKDTLSSPLQQAERDIAEYCSTTDYDPRCWALHDWLLAKVQDAESHMALGQMGGACLEEYQQLQQVVRELAAAGSIATMYTTLRTIKSCQERKAEQAASQAAATQADARRAAAAAAEARSGSSAFGCGMDETSACEIPLPKPPTNTSSKAAASSSSSSRGGSSSSSSSGVAAGIPADTRALLTQVFRRADSDANGLLTWDEFAKIMHAIEDDLSEDEQETIANALQLEEKGVTLEQFIDIVEEAEAAKAATDAQFLRHLTHHTGGNSLHTVDYL